jgi:hypothetical protein
MEKVECTARPVVLKKCSQLDLKWVPLAIVMIASPVIDSTVAELPRYFISVLNFNDFESLSKERIESPKLFLVRYDNSEPKDVGHTLRYVFGSTNLDSFATRLFHDAVRALQPTKEPRQSEKRVCACVALSETTEQHGHNELPPFAKTQEAFLNVLISKRRHARRPFAFV